jgi:glucose/arabinose dehydrogenase
MLHGSKLSYSTVVLVVLAFLVTGASLTGRSSAQFRPIPAPGFQLNIFADPTNVPDFVSCSNPAVCYTGPISITFDSRGRLFVATGGGRVLILTDNNQDGRADEVKTFATGLPQPFGLEFRENGDLFVASNVVGGPGRVIRLRDLNGDDLADEETVVVDNLPSRGDHQTSKLKFGPDGLLYIAQGSATDDGEAGPGQVSEGPLNAAILRVNVDSVTPTVEVFCTGLRNPFGMAFDPASGELFAVDVGSGELGEIPDTSPNDEVNWIVAGGNYGFPLCEGVPDSGNPACAGVRGPILALPQHITPTSIAFYTGPQAGDDRNQMLVTLLKRLGGTGGDLRRYALTGNAATGFQLSEVKPPMADFDVIDPNDGPVDTAIDPISGDIYVARFDPVHHADVNEHHHFIYRIHRAGSDSLPFIGRVRPSAVKAGSAALTISLITRHVGAGAVMFDVTDGVPLSTRPGPLPFELLADLPANLLTTERTIMLEVRNPDGTPSNQQPFAVTRTDPGPTPEKAPQLGSLLVYKKKRANVIDQIVAGASAKKYRLVATGTDFDSGAELLVNNAPLELESASASELVGRMTNSMVKVAGELNIQVRNSTGKVSNVLKLVVVP